MRLCGNGPHGGDRGVEIIQQIDKAGAEIRLCPVRFSSATDPGNTSCGKDEVAVLDRAPADFAELGARTGKHGPRVGYEA